jgi:hypothetical protein
MRCAIKIRASFYATHTDQGSELVNWSFLVAKPMKKKKSAQLLAQWCAEVAHWLQATITWPAETFRLETGKALFTFLRTCTVEE